MSQLSKSEQSRLNGTKSQGPITPEGKQRAAFNALKHGMFSYRIVIPGEDEDAFNELHDEFLAEHNPSTPQQRELVEQIIAATWRLRRLHMIEATLMESAMRELLPSIEAGTGDDTAMKKRYHIARAFEQLALTPTLKSLSRFESRLSTQLARATRTLLRRSDSIHPHSLVLPNGSRILALPSSERSSRGYSAVTLLILDEAARLPDPGTTLS